MSILVYSPRITPRIEYICGLLLGNLLHAKWQLTNNIETIQNHNGPKICYARDVVDPSALHIPAHGFLQERGVRRFQPDIKSKNKMPLLFPVSDNNEFGFDMLAAAFYLVSRYEEYLPHEKDTFGRFEAKESFAFRHGFLQIPLVNHYALWLKKALQEKFEPFKLTEPTFAFIPTYDVDVAFAYKGRGLLRTMLGVLRSLWTLNPKAVTERFRVLTGKQQDPFDTYDYQLKLSKNSGIKPYYFILCGNYGQYDKNIAFYARSFFSIVKKLGDYAHIGLHPSFASNDEEALLGMEVLRLSNILNRDINCSRQHYLKLLLPKTYQNLLKANISYDFSMGYASQPGFRAGICSPYLFYDLESESVSPLTVIPLAVMDGTFFNYLKTTPAESFKIIQNLINEIESVGGTFVSLWHNDSLRREDDNTEWVDLYEKVFQLAASKHTKKNDPLHTA